MSHCKLLQGRDSKPLHESAAETGNRKVRLPWRSAPINVGCKELYLGVKRAVGIRQRMSLTDSDGIGQDSEVPCHPHQIDEGRGGHLPHELTAMHFDRGLAEL